ncbi:methylenetetrahydrofolate reductase [NAD(P)H] [Miniphocaeibacter massiliensis]|uniref:methylenetetrahydrofolate reductase [NAD(P)H] n=1 Tax=Miniphocaeibacter massiliensis TaxID=2041841 RepID=UPI000C1BCA38|nr:methylenetetrahydrofolate reductase [NAD(P)H] [Miniphocaeibacter massiliensis]
MKIIDLFKNGKQVISYEVFPPKTSSGFESVQLATKEIAKLNPGFISVTYGASGGTSDYTIDIASDIQKNLDVTSLAHLTCVTSNKETIINQLKKLKENNIENILALRGDLPSHMKDLKSRDYSYASDLMKDINEFGDFCIGGACYPEGHVESEHLVDDIKTIKSKVDMGCKFLITQMFFDNNILYNFLYKLRDAGIDIPVIAGIMPVTNAKQIKRIVELSGTYLPQRFKTVVDKFGHNPKAMAQAGIAYATEQIIGLYANGVNGIHVYSMNKPEIASAIHNNLSEIVNN